MKPVTYDPGSIPTLVGAGGVLMVATDDLDLITSLDRTALSVSAVVDALSADGLASMPGFACLVRGDGHWTALVRGEFAVEVDEGGEITSVAGNGVTTWAERVIPQTTGQTLSLAADGSEPTAGLPVTDAVVLAARVAIGASLAGAVSKNVEPAEQPDVRPPTPTFPVPAQEPAQTLEPDPNATIVDVEENRFEAMFGQTVPGRRPEDAAVRDNDPDQGPPTTVAQARSVDPPPAPILGDHDGRTMTAAELRRLRGESASPPQEQAGVVGRPATTAEITLSTGRVIVVDRPVAIGRNPQARQVSSAGLPLLVVIESHYISGTHLLVNVEGDDVLATDTSRNGTYLTRQGGRPERMVKGQPTLLSDGCSLQLADEVSATVSVRKAG